MSCDLHGSTVLVTGAIGLATGLAGLGARVAVVGRRANRRAKRSSTVGYDRDLALRLWEVSSALVGIEQNPKWLYAKEQG